MDIDEELRRIHEAIQASAQDGVLLVSWRLESTWMAGKSGNYYGWETTAMYEPQ